MSGRRRNRLDPLVLAFLAAILIHAQLLFSDLLPSLHSLWSRIAPAHNPTPPRRVERVAIPSSQWEANRALLPASARLVPRGPDAPPSPAATRAETPRPAEPPKVEVEKQKPDNARMDGQVVDVAPTADNRPPKNARFLSEHNTNVEKETVSRHRRADYGVAQPHPTMARVTTGPEERAEKTGDSPFAIFMQKAGSGSAGARQGRGFALEIPDVERRAGLDLKLKLGGDGPATEQAASDRVRGNSDRLRLNPGGGEAGEEPPGEGGQDDRTLSMLKRADPGKLAMVSGAPANDHITGIPEGEETLLNTREFKYATFFNRVKRGVSNHWNPAKVYMERDPYGNIYGVRDRYTVLNVELDATGALADMNVAHSCGLEFLDEEAMAAFRKASPFPNPPAGLLDERGRIAFQFGFYFEIGDRPAVRVFRSGGYPPPPIR